MAGIIKWPGGKGQILKTIRPLIPYRRLQQLFFVDPFVGGGSSFLFFQPKKLWINDIHPLLIELYKAIAKGDEKTQSFMEEVGRFWDNMDDIIGIDIETLGDRVLFFKWRWNASLPKALKEYITLIGEHIEASLHAKKRRLNENLALLYRQKDLLLGKKEMELHLRTAIRAGVYYFFRELLNNQARFERHQAITYFFFVRELCFGSMFRQNSHGKFNIPYGGISYNKKKLLPKIAYIFGPKVRGLLSGAEITSLDYKEVLLGISNIGKNTFLFLDPPYISDFSEYDGKPFGEEEHRWLVEYIANFPGEVLIAVGGKTNKMYEVLPLHQKRLLSKYSYSARNRNKKDTEYLILSSFPLKTPLLEIRQPLLET